MQPFTTALLGFFILSASSSTPALPATASAFSAPPAFEQTYKVAMTGYNAVPGQTDDTPFVTASGSYSDPDVVAARSQDLADELPFGTVIALVRGAATSTSSCGLPLVEEIIGYRVIADTMNARMRNKIDILFHTDDAIRIGGKYINPARVLGSCKSVQIRVVGKVDVNKMPHTQEQLRLAIGNLPLAFGK